MIIMGWSWVSAQARVAGDVVGGTLAAVWMFAAQMQLPTVQPNIVPRPPTIADSVAAHGVVSWMLFLSIALLGAATWLVVRRDREPRPEESIMRRIVEATVAATGWGVMTALFGMWRGWDPLLIGWVIYPVSIVADLFTQGLTVLVKQIMKNPVKALRYYRIGRTADLLDIEGDRAAAAQLPPRADDSREGMN